MRHPRARLVTSAAEAPEAPEAPGAGRRVKEPGREQIAEPSEASLPADWGADPENQKPPR
jgi:hypothetical protein